MHAMSDNKINKLAVSVLAFHKIFCFIQQYWCYEVISIKGYCI